MMPTVVPGGLPAEYLAVEYLEGTGTQYINVDDELKQYEFEVTALTSEKRSDSGAMIMGNEQGNDANAFAVWQLVNYVSVRRRAGTISLNNDAYISWNDGKAKKLKYICTQAYGEIVDANTNVSLAKNTNIIAIYSSPAWLFHGYSNKSTYTNNFKGRIYSAKYFLNGSIAYDLIPCIRIADSKPGMYDLVGRQFYVNQGTGEFVVGWYVDDGLVMNLDGLNRGGVSGEWHDLVDSENIVTLSDNYTELANGIDFYDASGYGTFAKETKISRNVGTIEFAVELTALETTGRPVACLSGAGYIGGSIASKSGSTGAIMRYYLANTTVNAWYINDEVTKITASGNEDCGMINGKNASLYEGFSSLTPYTKQLLGARGSGNKFKGIIHAVRVYNRKLTAEEMLQNQRVDNFRYNLGLTI